MMMMMMMMMLSLSGGDLPHPAVAALPVLDLDTPARLRHSRGSASPYARRMAEHNLHRRLVSPAADRYILFITLFHFYFDIVLRCSVSCVRHLVTGCACVAVKGNTVPASIDESYTSKGGPQPPLTRACACSSFQQHHHYHHHHHRLRPRPSAPCLCRPHSDVPLTGPVTPRPRNTTCYLHLTRPQDGDMNVTSFRSKDQGHAAASGIAAFLGVPLGGEARPSQDETKGSF
jgi:hypothetical protein